MLTLFSVGKFLLHCQIFSSMLNLLRCMWCSRELFNCTWSVCLCAKISLRTIISLCALNCCHGSADSCIFKKGRVFPSPAFFSSFQWVYCLGRGMFYQRAAKASAGYSLLAAEGVVCISSFPTPIRQSGPPSPCPGCWWPPVGNGKIETPTERFELQPWEKLGLV